ncbi:MAG: SDR family oxidoreductase [Chlamydiales bacterium]
MKAIITGANRGIGLALATTLKAKGWEVLALCRKATPELKALGVSIEEGVDVTSENSLQIVADRHKEEKFDLLINNAGINHRMNLDAINYKAIHELFETNTLGPIKTALAFLPLLKEGAKIAMISSIAGSIGDIKEGGRYGYRMSKAALNSFSKTLSIDLKAQKISVIMLHPGHVQTDMTDGGGEYTPTQAAENLVQRIEELTLEKTGTFLRATGEPLPF